MILNKFSIHLLQIWLLAFILFSCSKNADINGNKSYISVTHTAINVGPLNLKLNGIALFSTPITYGQTTGIDGNPYDTSTSGVRELQLFQGDSLLLQGNTSFQQGAHYSMFFFNNPGISYVNTIVFQDNQGVRNDTFTNVRYLNFSPGSNLGIYMTNSTDTFSIQPSPFVGYNTRPTEYVFVRIPIGSFGVRAFENDTTFIDVDSIRLDSAKNYNIYLQGYFDSTSNGNNLHLKSVRLN